METANILLAIGGDKGNCVPKYGVTAAEVAVLRFLHGEDAVFDIEVIGQVQRTHRQEIARLAEIYGRQDGDRRVSPAVDALFPGAAARVFETFEELEIPEELYKAETRKTARAPVQQPKAESEPTVNLSSMTIVQLQALATKLGVDLHGITKKADIIEAIQLHQQKAEAAQAGAAVEAEDAGDDEDMNDDIAKGNMFE